MNRPPSSWVTSMVQETHIREVVAISCNKQKKTGLYWVAIEFFQTCLSIAHDKQNKHDNDKKWPIFYFALLKADKIIIDKIAFESEIMNSWGPFLFLSVKYWLNGGLIFYCEKWILTMAGEGRERKRNRERFSEYLCNNPLLLYMITIYVDES